MSRLTTGFKTCAVSAAAVSWRSEGKLMRPVRMVALFFFCMSCLHLAPLFAQKGKDDKTASSKAQKAYQEMTVEQLQRAPALRENLKNRDVRVRDLFGCLTDIYPGTLQKKLGITRDKYLEFSTADVGSRMRCYLPLSKENKDTISLVKGLIPGAPILLEGTFYDVVNNMSIFMVDKVYSGYEAPKETGKPEITMIMYWEGDPKPYKYTIPKPGEYVLKDPTTNKKITVEFKY
jgi:hypothetical protein